MIKKVFYGWWLVGILFLFGLFGNGIISYSFTTLIEPLAREFGWSYTQISLAMSIRGFEIGLGAPLIGWLIDRWGSKKVVSSGAAMLCLGLLLLSQSRDLLLFYAAFILIGLGMTCFTMPITVIIVGNWFKKRIGLATGIAISGTSISGIFIPLITHIIELYSWRIAILGILISILIIILPLTFLLRDKPDKYGLLADGQPSINAEKVKDKGSARNTVRSKGIRQALGALVFWQLALMFTCLLFINNALVTHIMPYLSSVGIDRYTASIAAGGIPLISAIGRTSAGWLADRFDKKLLTAVLFAIVSMAMVCCAFIQSNSTWLTAPFFLLFGFGVGGGATMAGLLVRTWQGDTNFGTIFGIMMGIPQLANIISAPLAGWVYDTWGTYQPFWFVTAGIAVMAMMITMTVSFPRATD
jgi:MFS family permease